MWMEIEQEAFSAAEVAAKLGVSDMTVRRWIRSGQLPSFKVGSARRVPRTALDELMRPTGRAKPRADAPVEDESDDPRR